MGEVTGISWTDHTFNPWIGCTKVSAACDHCYAEQGSKRLASQHGLQLWEGDRYFTGASYWQQPARWNRAAARDGVQRRVFCASYADVFEDRPGLDEKRAALWSVIASTQNLTWQLLTKRPENIRAMVPARWLSFSPRNVWYGTTAETQEWLDKRAPILLDVPAAAHFLSVEPQLECVSLRGFRPSWCITGGESGPHARPYNIAWARSLIRECRANGYTAPFVKQMGDRPFDGDAACGFKAHHGADPSEWPEDLRVQEWPLMTAGA
jgi:protein gp37